jgi:hypothetical protein
MQHQRGWSRPGRGRAVQSAGELSLHVHAGLVTRCAQSWGEARVGSSVDIVRGA